MNLSVKLAMVSSLFFIGGMSFLMEQVARPLSAQTPLKVRGVAGAPRGAPEWTAGAFVQAPPVRVFEEVPREPQVVMASTPYGDLPPMARDGDLPPVWSVSSAPQLALAEPAGFDAVVEAAAAADGVEAVRLAAGADASVGGDSVARAGKSQPRSYTVRQGDSLRKIARKYLNDESRWPEIQRLNKVSNADRIVVGSMLLLPPGDS